MIINKWDGGDLNGYYFHVIETIQHGSDIQGFSNVMVIQWFNYILFHILPNSLYGMMFFYASLSMSAYLIIYKIFSEFAFNKNLLFLFLLMIPIITLQSSFFGKDAYMLLLTSFVFMLFLKINYRKLFSKYNFIKIFLFLFCLFLIYSIRSYQAAIIILALYLTIISKNKLLFFIGCFIAVLSSIILFNLIIANFLGNVDFSHLSFSGALANVYAGGSLMLEPFIVPFHMLQIFRPFPWEANSIFMFIISIENVLILILIVFLTMKNFRKIIIRIRTNKLYTFLFFYVLISVFIYSFNPNMGDMTRREIYFIPFLMILLV
ncbi:hypothetical protein [Arcobacter sp. FWKO B]|uniref:hypothetical protein n=1 Tax=Arcobacter sp. FWKO B TaxID=2593672 RepID=UPI0018A58428|nr:hypothetical protein [Arcobacter sp. FWKO B]QOG12074.1 hypothetical protein FWKOB_04870 [Arcobacter sp. FWKO B]